MIKTNGINARKPITQVLSTKIYLSFLIPSIFLLFPAYLNNYPYHLSIFEFCSHTFDLIFLFHLFGIKF